MNDQNDQSRKSAEATVRMGRFMRASSAQTRLEAVAARLPGATVRASHNDVPVLHYRGKVHQVSCSWFQGRGRFRIFWPFPADRQNRAEFIGETETARAIVDMADGLCERPMNAQWFQPAPPVAPTEAEASIEETVERLMVDLDAINSQGQPEPSPGLVEAVGHQVGVLHPPVIRKVKGEGQYEIVSGGPRIMAAKRVGLKRIEVVVEPDAPSDHYMRLEVPDQSHAHPDCGCVLERDLETGSVLLHHCAKHAAALDAVQACRMMVEKYGHLDDLANPVVAAARAVVLRVDGVPYSGTRAVSPAETASYMRRNERGE